METKNEQTNPQDEKAIEETAKRLDITKKGLSKREKIVIFSVLGGAFILLSASGIIIFYRINQPSTIGSTQLVENQTPATNTNTEETEEVETEPEPVPEPQVYDQDGDGLPDEEEQKIWKTNPTKEDTDGDGLTDFDEVRSYNTDPLSKDTDGDGYDDNEELDAGYNPLGPGTL